MAAKHGQNDVYKRGLVPTLKMYPKFNGLLALQITGLILNAEEMSSKAGHVPLKKYYVCAAFGVKANSGESQKSTHHRYKNCGKLTHNGQKIGSF